MTTFASEMRFTNPGPYRGNEEALRQQGEWLRFAEKAEQNKPKGEMRDPNGLAELALQHAEDTVDTRAGIISLQVK